MVSTQRIAAQHHGQSEASNLPTVIGHGRGSGRGRGRGKGQGKHRSSNSSQSNIHTSLPAFTKKQRSYKRKHRNVSRDSSSIPEGTHLSNNSHTSDQPHQSENESESNQYPPIPPMTFVPFTLANFSEHVASWNQVNLWQALAKQKLTNLGRMPVEIEEQLQSLQEEYIWSKLMLALLGNVSEDMVNKYLWVWSIWFACNECYHFHSQHIDGECAC